jgi:hypothetical protein
MALDSSSRSRKAYMTGVEAPSSRPKDPVNMRWFMIRLTSAKMTRRYWARRGTSTSSSVSRAIAAGISLLMPESQSMRDSRFVICRKSRCSTSFSWPRCM